MKLGHLVQVGEGNQQFVSAARHQQQRGIAQHLGDPLRGSGADLHVMDDPLHLAAVAVQGKVKQARHPPQGGVGKDGFVIEAADDRKGLPGEGAFKVVERDVAFFGKQLVHQHAAHVGPFQLEQCGVHGKRIYDVAKSAAAEHQHRRVEHLRNPRV